MSDHEARYEPTHEDSELFSRIIKAVRHRPDLVAAAAQKLDESYSVRAILDREDQRVREHEEANRDYEQSFPDKPKRNPPFRQQGMTEEELTLARRYWLAWGDTFSPCKFDPKGGFKSCKPKRLKQLGNPDGRRREACRRLLLVWLHVDSDRSTLKSWGQQQLTSFQRLKDLEVDDDGLPPLEVGVSDRLLCASDGSIDVDWWEPSGEGLDRHGIPLWVGLAAEALAEVTKDSSDGTLAAIALHAESFWRGYNERIRISDEQVAQEEREEQQRLQIQQAARATATQRKIREHDLGEGSISPRSAPMSKAKLARRITNNYMARGRTVKWHKYDLQPTGKPNTWTVSLADMDAQMRRRVERPATEPDTIDSDSAS